MPATASPRAITQGGATCSRAIRLGSSSCANSSTPCPARALDRHGKPFFAHAPILEAHAKGLTPAAQRKQRQGQAIRIGEDLAERARGARLPVLDDLERRRKPAQQQLGAADRFRRLRAQPHAQAAFGFALDAQQHGARRAPLLAGEREARRAHHEGALFLARARLRQIDAVDALERHHLH